MDSSPRAWCIKYNQYHPASHFPQNKNGHPYTTCLRCRVLPPFLLLSLDLIDLNIGLTES
ncbi:hypothetical protein NA56DRAFT_377313 [Hyaloscypha hepaticicola]|uniref:Uncharacterized protein n=1 Tax=Hyaloscypha hepaticicola TaxID=2082293 RepID=A0A2J6PK79_9HELO|nr:hypothetical protein NA56DRAFT_377313 [Hyaloscypha hepaticicola]